MEPSNAWACSLLCALPLVVMIGMGDSYRAAAPAALLLGATLVLLPRCGGETRSGSGGDGHGDSTVVDEVPDPWDVHCFPAGTRIASPTGAVPIEQLELGSEVFGFDEGLGRLVVERVTRTLKRDRAPLIQLRLEDGRLLRATSEHPFFVPRQDRYVPLGQLKPEQELLTFDAAGVDSSATPATLRASSFESTLPEVVYNVSVSGTHNYFAEGVLVHNKSPNECPFNPSLCLPACPGDPTLCHAPQPSCLPVLHDSSEAWISCGAGLYSGQALWLPVEPRSANLAPVGAQGVAGAGGADGGQGPGGAAGAWFDAAGAAGDTGIDEAWPDNTVQLGTEACPEGLSADHLQVTLVAADTAVTGQLELGAAQDACGSDREPDSVVTVGLQPNELRSYCMPYTNDDAVVRLLFENWHTERTTLGVVSIVEGCPAM